MKMYVIRHGETDWNREGRLQGRTDVPLNDIGREQAARCGDALKDAGIRLIITSPLRRAAETGEIIRGRIGEVPLLYDSLLSERDFGTMNGEIADERDAENWPAEVGAETKEELAARVWQAMENFRALYGEETILVITHGAALHSLLDQVTGGTLNRRPAELKNGGINLIEDTDGVPELTLFDLDCGEFREKTAGRHPYPAKIEGERELIALAQERDGINMR